MAKTTAKNWTGIKKEYLTFLIPIRKNGTAWVWLAECDCGNTIEIIPANVSSKGRTISCGCKRKEGMSKGGEKTRIYDPKISTARTVWRCSYKDGCDFETFLCLSQKDCYYCGRPPSNVNNRALARLRRDGKGVSDLQVKDGYFIYNGLDRIDNNKDHTPDNIVPCCRTCNWMKSTLTPEEFKAHIARIHAHMRIRSSPAHIAAANEIIAIFAAI